MSDTYSDSHDDKIKTWLKRLDAEKKEHASFRKEAEKALDIYERKDCDGKKTVFPMYTANVNILHAALFSGLPDADVRRPHNDQGDKDLAQAIQRSIEHLKDVEDYETPAHRAVREFLAAGLGVCFLRYEPTVVEVPIMEPMVEEVIDPMTGQVMEQPVIDPETGEPVMEALRDEDGKLITEDSIESQTIQLDYHPWHRFRWEPTTDWTDVDWVSLDFIKTASQIKAEYGVELDNLDKRNDNQKAPSADGKGGHLVHHIYCKKSRTIKVITPAHRSFIAEYEDPFGLEGFYPFPRPLMMNIQSGEVTPRPDYVYIETQHDNLQVLTKRINKLTEGVKDIGAFDAALFAELGSLESAQDGKYIPISGMAERLNGGSFDNVIASVNMTNKVSTLDRLREQREDEKNIIYELMGIADIVRGASVASETATAQAIKDKHFQVRLSEKINELRRYWRDLYRLITELMGEHFTTESFFMFSGVELDEQALQALMNELGRAYMVDVETEDTTFEDDEKERQQGIELIRVLGEIIGQHYPAVQAGAMPGDFFNTLLTFGANLFKDGAVLEEGIATLPDTAAQYAQFEQQMSQLQGENEQLNQQLMEMQGMMEQMQQQIGPIEQAERAAGVQGDQAKAAKDAAEAQQTQIENAQLIRGQMVGF